MELSRVVDHGEENRASGEGTKESEVVVLT